MNDHSSRHFITFVGWSLVALLVWNYYRHRTYGLADKYSTFDPRFWTGFVDSAVLWPVSFIVTVLLSLHIPRSVAALLVTGENLAWLFYTVVMHARYGQTVGKMATKVRVVDFRTEGPISFRNRVAISTRFVSQNNVPRISNPAAPEDTRTLVRRSSVGAFSRIA